MKVCTRRYYHNRRIGMSASFIHLFTHSFEFFHSFTTLRTQNSTIVQMDACSAECTSLSHNHYYLIKIGRLSTCSFHNKRSLSERTHLNTTLHLSFNKSTSMSSKTPLRKPDKTQVTNLLNTVNANLDSFSMEISKHPIFLLKLTLF